MMERFEFEKPPKFLTVGDLQNAIKDLKPATLVYVVDIDETPCGLTGISSDGLTLHTTPAYFPHGETYLPGTMQESVSWVSELFYWDYAYDAVVRIKGKHFYAGASFSELTDRPEAYVLYEVTNRKLFAELLQSIREFRSRVGWHTSYNPVVGKGRFCSTAKPNWKSFYTDRKTRESKEITKELQDYIVRIGRIDPEFNIAYIDVEEYYRIWKIKC